MNRRSDDWEFDPYLDARLSQDPAKRRPEQHKLWDRGRSRSERMALWWNAAERDLVKRACAAAGQDQSSWVRRALRLAALAELHKAAHRKESESNGSTDDSQRDD